MELEGVVTNGVVVPDDATALPEGARVRLEVIDESDDERYVFPDLTVPPDHPLAPYNCEVELAILRESIEDMKAGKGRPWREVMDELSRKHGLGPLPQE